ncbi:hypothetical protein FS749_013860 [Ceratobasidium sp. UAMH 11750]|nr:hypothetical protein FS749_013860 [Ceratobasidium sp. UAMH 11750]
MQITLQDYCTTHMGACRRCKASFVTSSSIFQIPGSWGSPTEINLVESYQADNPFARFDLYRSYIKNLNIYGPKNKLFKVTGWKILIARAQRQALLPNLQTLSIQTTCNSHGPDQPMWVGAFSTPSLVNLLIAPSDLSLAPTVSYPAASMILKSLIMHHPKIERLGLFPDSNLGRDGSDGGNNLLAFLSGRPFYEYIGYATGLRHLSCTLAWFKEKPLQVLGHLPHLESITVCSAVDSLRDESPVLLDGSFPSLRSLSLHVLNPFDIADIMDITELTKNLMFLDLRFNFELLLHIHDFEEGPWFTNEFFPLLLNAPCVIDLRIEPDPVGMMYDPFHIHTDSLSILQRLPLQSLRLGQIRISDYDSDLASIWPSVTHLHIPQHYTSFHTFPRFAALPALKHLELDLDLKTVPAYEPRSIQPSALTVLEAGPWSAVTSDSKELDTVAHLLLDIWSNLTHVVWPEPKASDDELLEKMFACKSVKSLNGYIATLRDLRGLRLAQS